MMEYELRDYQQEAIGKCLDAFVSCGKTSVMLESPVGSGKTYMALEMLHRLQEHVGSKLSVGWIAPRHHLLQQMMVANRDLYQDNIRPISLFERNVPHADMVILDEAHHEATQSCVMLYEKIAPKLIMGLSATPLRTDRMKLSFQTTVKTCSIRRLIRDDFLSKFNSYLMPRYSPEDVAEQYLASPARWGKSIAYFSTIAECLRFQRLMGDGGIDVEVVTADSDKDRQLMRFFENKVKVVANVAMLSEGFDQPDVTSIFARDASRLPTIQMCGRGLRKAHGKEACNIVQSTNTKYLFERVAPAKTMYRFQGGRWLSLNDGTKEIEETIARTLHLMELRGGKKKLTPG